MGPSLPESGEKLQGLKPNKHFFFLSPLFICNILPESPGPAAAPLDQNPLCVRSAWGAGYASDNRSRHKTDRTLPGLGGTLAPHAFLLHC